MHDHAEHQGDPALPPPPAEPDPGECCGGGCDPCVYDYYDRALEKWRARCDAIRAAQAGGPGSGSEASG